MWLLDTIHVSPPLLLSTTSRCTPSMFLIPGTIVLRSTRYSEYFISEFASDIAYRRADDVSPSVQEGDHGVVFISDVGGQILFGCGIQNGWWIGVFRFLVWKSPGCDCSLNTYLGSSSQSVAPGNIWKESLVASILRRHHVIHPCRMVAALPTILGASKSWLAMCHCCCPHMLLTNCLV
jgi:hypothetical protein